MFDEIWMDLPTAAEKAHGVPAEKWNALVSHVAQNRLLGVRAGSTPRFRHPWKHTFSWDAEGKRWEATVNPGSVNGLSLLDPVPLRGFREPSPVPDFFAGKLTDRRLLACDVVLQIPRVYAKVSLEVVDTIPELIVSYHEPTGDPTLFSIPEYVPDPELLPGEIQPDWEDTPYHREHLSTVYLLSPLDVAEDAEPDKSWSPYAQHHIFWNLNFSATLPPQAIIDTRLRSPGLGLGLGVTDNLQQAIIDDINATTATAQILLSKVTVVSKIWTL